MKKIVIRIHLMDIVEFERSEINCFFQSFVSRLDTGSVSVYLLVCLFACAVSVHLVP